MYINKFKTIVIKIGSSLIIDNKNQIRTGWLEHLALDIEYFVKNNKNIILVSSGAIALGCKKLNLKKKI